MLFNFMLKALSVRKIFRFLSLLFSHVRKQLNTKAKVHFNSYDVTNRETNKYNTHSVRYLKK